MGPTNTINRAELCGILHALTVCDSGRDVVIATDSRCSIDLITKMLRRPHTLQHSKHRGVLEAIAEAITTRARAQTRTTIVKVRAHTGVGGNEAADELAKQAALTKSGIPVHVGNDPYSAPGFYWPARVGGTTPLSMHARPKKAKQGHTHREEVPDKQPTPDYVSNLLGALQQQAEAHHATGGAKPGIYSGLWQTSARELHPSSARFWDSPQVSDAGRTQVLKARYGVLWNAKIAMRMGKAYPFGAHGISRGDCPLCHAPDSAAHMLGGCRDPHMRALFTARHDKAARILIEHMRKGAHGSFYMLADVGTPSSLEPLGVKDKRIPRWIIPEEAHTTRVDILMAHVPVHRTPRGTRHLRPGTTIDVVELTYRADHRRNEARAEKEEQHARTLACLRARGYNVRYHIWDISNTGAMTSDLARSAAELGVQDPDALLGALHEHTVAALLGIVTERRQREARLLARGPRPNHKPNMRKEHRPP
jgi:ribonuclease HI